DGLRGVGYVVSFADFVHRGHRDHRGSWLGTTDYTDFTEGVGRRVLPHPGRLRLASASRPAERESPMSHYGQVLMDCVKTVAMIVRSRMLIDMPLSWLRRSGEGGICWVKNCAA